MISLMMNVSNVKCLAYAEGGLSGESAVSAASAYSRNCGSCSAVSAAVATGLADPAKPSPVRVHCAGVSSPR